MNWTIPGTTLDAPRETADAIDMQMRALFLAGGLTLSQVAAISGLEPYTIQNWVKRGFLPPARGKRYNMEQLCRILNINLLRLCMPLEQICTLMAYLNGSLSDESDDLVDDTLLYFLFVRLAARARHIGGSDAWEDALEQITRDYREPVPGAREKLIRVLRIMLTAWVSGRMRLEAEKMVRQLKEEPLSPAPEQ